MPSGVLKREDAAGDSAGPDDGLAAGEDEGSDADDGSSCISSKPAVVKKAVMAAGVIVVTHWR